MTNKAVVVDGVDVLLLGDHVTEAATGRVLEGDAGGLWPQDAVDVITVVELIVEPLRDTDRPRGIAILHNDEVVGLEERPPHLQEVQVPDRRNDDVQLVLQQRRARDRRPRASYRRHYLRRPDRCRGATMKFDLDGAP